MACLHPVRIKVDSSQGITYKEVPCGKCLDCVRRYQNSWYVRFLEQCKDTPKCIFFTLTYRNGTVPFSYNRATGETVVSVCKADVQKWLKRGRKRLSLDGSVCGVKIKYFIAAEYGPTTLRPHYHGLVWNLPLHYFRKYFLSDWESSFGFVTFRVLPANIESSADAQRALRYVAKYCNKGPDFENKAVLSMAAAPVFRLMSKGIGESYVTRSWKYHVPDVPDFKKKLQLIVNRLNYKVGNFSYCLPRYYYDKFYKAKSALKIALQRFLQKASDRVYNCKLERLQQIQKAPFASVVSFMEIRKRAENFEMVRFSASRYASFLQCSRL